MGKNILLSIIIPIFNGEKYINNIINSIIQLNQDILSSLQIILVNDGSIDNSYNICLLLSKNYPFIECHTKSNGGIAAARNYALKYAQGKYLTFCDQDDFLMKSYKSFINKIEETNADMIIADSAYKHNGVICQCHKVKRDEICEDNRKNDISRFLIGGIERVKNKEEAYYSQIPNSIWNVIFRRSIIVENNIHLYSIVDYEDDWRFITECVLHSKKIVLCTDYYYVWNVNYSSESHSGKYIHNFLEKRIKAVNWNIDKLKSLDISDEGINEQLKLEAKRTIIWGFYNACALKLDVFLIEMKIIISTLNKYMPLYKYADGESEFIFLFLLQNKLLKLAYFINKKLLKRRYH